MVIGRKRILFYFVAFVFTTLLDDCSGQKTRRPTLRPTLAPTTNPSTPPTISISPTSVPSTSPTSSPSATPTISPTASPTKSPTDSPTRAPTEKPTNAPTVKKTKPPTAKPTLSPSLYPTIQPTKLKLTPRPTETPTKAPTTKPSRRPTRRPTDRPTSRPTSRPTNGPTNGPTNRPTRKPTAEPTSLPSSIPSSSPSSIPSSSPSSIPSSTPTKGYVSVVIPIITFDVILLNGEGTSSEQIQSIFVNFLDGVLQESSESYRFDYSHLDSNGTISMFNETDTFGTEYRVQMDGVSNYLDEGPTTEALVQSLNVYFSFWGAEDLEDYLEKSGLEKTEVVSISIDGENVSFVSNVREEETEKEQEQEQGKQDVQNIFDNIFTNDEGELSKRAVITIYSSVVAVAVAVALVVFRHRIGQRRLAQNGEAPSNDTHLGANCDGDDDEEKGGRKKIPTAASDKRSTDPKLGSDAKQTLHTSSSVEKASLNTSQDPAAKICETGSPPKPAAMNEANTSASDAKSDTNGSCLTSPVSPEKSQVSPDLANVASF